MDPVNLKRKLVTQLTEKQSTEFIEGWKQQRRNEKAEILGNRQRMLTDVAFNQHQLTPIEPLKKKMTKYDVLQELQKTKGTTVKESWKSREIEKRCTTFQQRHDLLNEISEHKNLKNNLVKNTKCLTRADLMQALRTNVIVPQWKLKQFNTKAATIKNKHETLVDITEKKVNLKDNRTFLDKRSDLLNSVRIVPVEEWKQKNQVSIGYPHIQNKQVLNEIILNNNRARLVAVGDKRAKLLDQLRENPLEAWREQQRSQRATAMKNKHVVCLEITNLTTNEALKQIPSHIALMESIRNHRSPARKVIVEGWKQQERNARANAIAAKSELLVSLLSEKVKLNNTKKDSRAEVLTQLRTESTLESWKQKLYDQRSQAINNKNAICNEIMAKLPNLNSSTSQLQNKINLHRELRQQSNQILEGWKEKQREDVAKQLGNSISLRRAIKNHDKASLKSTKNDKQNRAALMKEIRGNKQNNIPEWQEDERIIRSSPFVVKQVVNNEIVSNKHSLKQTKSLKEVKSDILSCIRRNSPIEAWKEKERQEQAELYDTKRSVVNAIGNCPSPKCNRRQVDLKEELVKELRLNHGMITPLWKENKMSTRLTVLKNKHELNLQIKGLVRL